MARGPDPDSIQVRDATDADVGAMTAIYNALLTTTTIEWTDRLHTVEERSAWQHAQQAAGRPVLVAEAHGEVDGDGEVIGWASYGDFRDAQRWPGYRFTVELSIHVAGPWWGRGVGRLLIDTLVERARASGAHVMVAGIDGDNHGSVTFHERLGFEVVGRMAQIGRKHGRWLDLVLMQRMLTPASISHLVVDLGDVACAFRPRVRMDELVVVSGLTPADIEQRWWGSGLEAQAELGELGSAEVYEQLGGALGVDLAPEELRRLWSTAFAPDDDVLGLVGGVEVGRVLFTNNGPIVADCLEHELASVAAVFDRCVCSFELGHRKPSAEAFAALAALLDVDPGQLLLVDDSEANVDGARAAGLDAVAFTTVDDLRDQLAARALVD